MDVRQKECHVGKGVGKGNGRLHHVGAPHSATRGPLGAPHSAMRGLPGIRLAHRAPHSATRGPLGAPHSATRGLLGLVVRRGVGEGVGENVGDDVGLVAVLLESVLQGSCIVLSWWEVVVWRRNGRRAWDWASWRWA